MQRRRLLYLLALPLLAAGCMPPVGTAPVQQAPGPAVAAAYPPIGARWRVRVTEQGFARQTIADRDIAAVPVEFNGRRGYGLASATVTEVLDPAGFNTIGTIEGGRTAKVYTPEAGPFAWPLLAGKTWDTTYSHTDYGYGRSWPDARSHVSVVALEAVTVPAGTFQVYRIEYKGGIGTASSGGRRDPGSPGFETNDVYWYAPAAKLVVKSVVRRVGTHYAGSGWTTTELLTLPQ